MLVTASGRGLGKSIASVFLREGASVAITDIDEARAQAAYDELTRESDKGRVFVFTGDLTKNDVIRKCVDAVVARFRRIDVLVANMGSGKGSIDWNIPEDDWTAMMEINFNGARRMTVEVVPHMVRSNSGAIIYISSIAGREVIGAPLHYSVAKAGIIAYAKNMAHKLARQNIRVNAVCPGNIFFEDGTWDYKLREDKEKVLRMLDDRVPLNRLARPEEIAHVVVFLASEKASFITGSCIVADGGQTVEI